MASVEDSVHKKLSAGFADQRLSPAVLAMKMTRENLAVQEAALSYLINYILIMAEKPLIPFQMVELQNICKLLKISLEELGLTGKIQKVTVDTNEYLVV